MVIEPGNNINSSSNASSKARQSNGRSQNVDKSANIEASSGHRDNVSLSNVGQSLAKIEAAIANVPEVNAEKVARIKAQVDSGSYQVNPYSLAGKMLSQEEV